ncbi:hypothetical protein [Roseovarius salis]|uniref:hypothetical protein n=1 Tax=Roseovarius salis TaxID=3376063 RepID=UPI0037C73A46
MTDKPSSRELNVLHHFVGSHIEPPGAFPGAGEKTFAAMLAKGWIEWVDSPETNEHGYRITEAGEKAAYPE